MTAEVHSEQALRTARSQLSRGLELGVINWADVATTDYALRVAIVVIEAALECRTAQRETSVLELLQTLRALTATIELRQPASATPPTPEVTP